MKFAEREVELRRTDRAALVAELDAAGVRWASNGKDCCCFMHQDDNPSAGIFQDAEGCWKYKCFPCGDKAMDVFDVQAKRTGKAVKDVLGDFAREASGVEVKRQQDRRAAALDAERKALRVYPTAADAQRAACWQGKDNPPLTHEATYVYSRPGTREVELLVFRLRKPDGVKTFRQASPHQSGFILKGPAGRWPLYNRTRVANAPIAIVGEGEKVVHALTAVLPDGIAATTNAGGGEKGKAALTDWSPLAGKRVILWPDCDAPDEKRGGKRTGLEHMQAVADELRPHTSDVWWVDPDALGLPPGGDAADWLAADLAAHPGTTPAEQCDRLDVAVLARATPLRASADLREHYAKIAAGELRPVAWPWPCLSKLTLALQPGRLTTLVGEPGAGKSFLLTECLWHWLNKGEVAACLMLELDAVFHVKRLHAMLSGRPELLNMEWVRANGAEAASLYERHAADLDRAWAAIDTVPDAAQVTNERILAWLETRLAAGCRVAVVDPVSAVATEKPWITDRELIHSARRVAEKYGASVILATHFDRGGKKEAGSEAIRRFVDTSIFMVRHDRECTSRVLRHDCPMPQKHNRTLKVRKARLASGAGVDLAYDFDGKALRFVEFGVMTGAED
jgi:KaiC/GvpD/RAD55 family RecA-like ATPase